MKGDVETVFGAVIAALILFLGGALALLQQESVDELSDISQLSWIVLGVRA